MKEEGLQFQFCNPPLKLTLRSYYYSFYVSLPYDSCISWASL